MKLLPALLSIWNVSRESSAESFCVLDTQGIPPDFTTGRQLAADVLTAPEVVTVRLPMLIKTRSRLRRAAGQATTEVIPALATHQGNTPLIPFHKAAVQVLFTHRGATGEIVTSSVWVRDAATSSIWLTAGQWARPVILVTQRTCQTGARLIPFQGAADRVLTTNSLAARLVLACDTEVRLTAGSCTLITTFLCA